MFCPECGYKIKPGMEKCPECGNLIGENEFCGGFWGLIQTPVEEPEQQERIPAENPYEQEQRMMAPPSAPVRPEVRWKKVMIPLIAAGAVLCLLVIIQSVRLRGVKKDLEIKTQQLIDANQQNTDLNEANQELRKQQEDSEESERAQFPVITIPTPTPGNVGENTDDDTGNTGDNATGDTGNTGDNAIGDTGNAGENTDDDTGNTGDNATGDTGNTGDNATGDTGNTGDNATGDTGMM